MKLKRKNALPATVNRQQRSMIANPVTIQNRISKEEYIQTVQQLRQHILRGDCYEINFCQEFFAENAELDPVEFIP